MIFLILSTKNPAKVDLPSDLLQVVAGGRPSMVQAQGDYKEAEKCFREAFKMRHEARAWIRWDGPGRERSVRMVGLKLDPTKTTMGQFSVGPGRGGDLTGPKK